MAGQVNGKPEAKKGWRAMDKLENQIVDEEWDGYEEGWPHRIRRRWSFEDAETGKEGQDCSVGIGGLAWER